MRLHPGFGLLLMTVTAWSAELPPLPAPGPGPFQPTWDSLSTMTVPAWFRDAKFGIWAHWGPQCQPEQGDWYARRMYIESTPQYQYHVATYGHPADVGFKDIIHAWKAERFDARRLVHLYREAGARYFVAMANHHDNFDLWNSRYQPWNSVAIGPRQDLIGAWAAAARAEGLPFGVSVHAARAWQWLEVAQLADSSGPRQGVRYDGRLRKEDGRGTWWEGLNPQDLYAQDHHPSDDPAWTGKVPKAKPGDPPTAAYARRFLDRTLDLIDQHHPDLLYFDDGVLPLAKTDERIGLTIAAHLYNDSAARHGGASQAVMNTKALKESQRRALVLDIERGVSTSVDPQPWQTDTCIGGWHYLRSLYDRKGYKTSAQVVQMLCDIVSKNGNLLLNIPVRGDGTIDDEEERIVGEIGAWMRINGEAIYGTRPWTILGEGPSTRETPEAGKFGGAKDVRSKPYEATDLRFTIRDGVLYALVMAWPMDGRVVVTTLAAGAPGVVGDVGSVRLLGSPGERPFRRTAAGLEVDLPQDPPCAAVIALAIRGLDLQASAPALPGKP